MVERTFIKNILKQALQLCSHNTAKPTQRSPCQTHHTRTKHPAPLPCRLPCQHGFPTMPLHGAMGGRPSAAPSALQPHGLPELIQEPSAGSITAQTGHTVSSSLAEGIPGLVQGHAVRTGQKGTTEVSDRTV